MSDFEAWWEKTSGRGMTGSGYGSHVELARAAYQAGRESAEGELRKALERARTALRDCELDFEQRQRMLRETYIEAQEAGEQADIALTEGQVTDG